MATQQTIIVDLLDVRGSFLQVFEMKAVNNGKPAYSASFIFAPNHPATKAVLDAINAVATGRWKEKAGDTILELKSKDKLCIHDGMTKASMEGYKGNLFVTARNEKERPLLIGGGPDGRQPVGPDRMYSGCYVNAKVGVWAQDNQWGQRINATLLGIQFLRHGEKLGGSVSVASAEDFAPITPAPEEQSKTAAPSGNGGAPVDASKLFG